MAKFEFKVGAILTVEASNVVEAQKIAEQTAAGIALPETVEFVRKGGETEVSFIQQLPEIPTFPSPESWDRVSAIHEVEIVKAEIKAELPTGRFADTRMSVEQTERLMDAVEPFPVEMRVGLLKNAVNDGFIPSAHSPKWQIFVAKMQGVLFGS